VAIQFRARKPRGLDLRLLACDALVDDGFALTPAGPPEASVLAPERHALAIADATLNLGRASGLFAVFNAGRDFRRASFLARADGVAAQCAFLRIVDVGDHGADIVGDIQRRVDLGVESHAGNCEKGEEEEDDLHLAISKGF